MPRVIMPRTSARLDRRSALDGAIFSKTDRISIPFRIHPYVEQVAMLVKFPSLFSAVLASFERT
jgi:hypothetical protein